MGFGTIETFDSEGSAFRQHKQIVIAFKNQLKRFRKPGHHAGRRRRPVRAPPDAGATPGRTTAGTTPRIRTSATSTASPCRRSSTRSSRSRARSRSPTAGTPTTSPTDPRTGVIPRPVGPVAPLRAARPIGGTIRPSPTWSTLTAGNTPALHRPDPGRGEPQHHHRLRRPGARHPHVPAQVRPVADETPRTSARSTSTQHRLQRRGAPRCRRGSSPGRSPWSPRRSTTGPTSTDTGVTVDAYLTQPVGARTLNFGHEDAEEPLGRTPTPTASTGILAVDRRPGHRRQRRPERGRAADAVPAAPSTASTPGSTSATPSPPSRARSRIQYLLDHGTFDVIDANNNGLITAPEIQTFVDTSATIGLPEAGAMARLLGGTRPDPDAVHHLRRRAARPARRPAAPVQLLRLREPTASSTA